MTNYELLEKLDTLLDDVDHTLMSMELGREQKQILTGLTYKMYALAETAVIAEDPATQ
jgi:uncharacterized protein Yka (UPF0111/DUF47 family)